VTEELDWGILAQSVGPRVRVLRNALAAHSIAVSAPHRLPTGSLTVLALIAANPGSSQTALAGRAGINKSALVGIVEQLEREGLVGRERAADDRRRYQILVTPEGERVMQTLYETVIDGERPIRDALGERDLAQLMALLDRAIAGLEKEAAGAG
jgi:DNA-binding MarR family transcriptional regulator